ncbi:MAG: hypothetical protein AABX86_01085, partial [Nanoarchaeota archaeon]
TIIVAEGDTLRFSGEFSPTRWARYDFPEDAYPLNRKFESLSAYRDGTFQVFIDNYGCVLQVRTRFG